MRSRFWQRSRRKAATRRLCYTVAVGAFLLALLLPWRVAAVCFAGGAVLTVCLAGEALWDMVEM